MNDAAKPSPLPPPPDPTSSPTVYRLAQTKFFGAIFRYALRALCRHRVPDPPGSDIAQEVTITAFEKWPTYSVGQGTPGQWVSGIVANKLLHHWRSLRNEPGFLGGEALEAMAMSPGDAMAKSETWPTGDRGDDLLHYMLLEERRVVFLVERAGCSFEEAAALEGISKTAAWNRYHAGLDRVRKLLERDKLRGAAVLPVSIAALLHEDLPEPTPEQMDAMLRRVCGHFGFEPPSFPPASGARPVDRDSGAPLSAVPRGTPHGGVLGPLGGLVAGLVAGAILTAAGMRGCAQHDRHDVTLTSAATSAPGLAVVAAPGPEPWEIEPVPAPATEPPAPTARPTQVDASDDGDDGDGELMIVAEAALATHDVRRALDALFAAAQIHPAGKHKDRRVQLISELCAKAPDRRCPRKL